MLKVNDILVEVTEEIHRQREKWGEQSHSDYYWYGILGEEFGEAGKALIENAVSNHLGAPFLDASGKMRLNFIQEKSENPLLRKELFHVAAVALSWVAAIDRRKTSI